MPNFHKVAYYTFKVRYSVGSLITIFYAHLLRKEDTGWVKKCMECEMKGSRPRGTPKRTWKEVVQKDFQACNLNKQDAMYRGRWKKLIKIG